MDFLQFDGANPGTRPVVLVVDDVPECVEMMGAMLEPEYIVRGATSGRDALQQAMDEPHPDVMLLDVMMPDMDGHSLLAALRDDPRTRDIPAIFVTSLPDAGDQLECLSSGAADLIVKPAAPSLLHARVRNQIELRRARERLERRNRELQEEVSRRLALESQLQHSITDLQAFSYSVSHDLRAPLTAIGAFAAAVRESEAEAISPTALHRLDRIVAGSSRMNSMIDDMLACARADHAPLQGEAVDLQLLAAEVSVELQPLYPGAQVEIGALPIVVADRGAMRQVLANLIGNALKFSAGQARPRVRVDAVAKPGAHEIRVVDNGAGFDPAFAGKLFTLFHRLHSESDFPGSGVGLAIVKRLVARHGGTVGAQSVPGAETTFSFTLPQRPQ